LMSNKKATGDALLSIANVNRGGGLVEKSINNNVSIMPARRFMH
jgi:hypothetical protein